MKKSTKNKRTLVPIENPLVNPSKKRLPKKSIDMGTWMKPYSKYHN